MYESIGHLMDFIHIRSQRICDSVERYDPISLKDRCKRLDSIKEIRTLGDEG